MNLPSTLDGDGLAIALLLSLGLEGLLQSRDVELFHRHHRAHYALNSRGVGALQHSRDDARKDLPGDTELVGEPAALARRSALGKLLPQRVNLGLIVAIDDERKRGRELEMRSAVQRQELLTVDLEQDGHHRAGGTWSSGAVSRRRDDPAVLEDREVVGDRLLRLEIEPEAGRDLLRARHR